MREGTHHRRKPGLRWDPPSSLEHPSSRQEEYSDLNFAQVARDEGRRCLLMCVAFAIAIAHLYIYPALFGVRIVDQAEVPADSSKCGSSVTSSSAYRIPRGNVRPRG
jgi:hypothetical protein